MTNSLHPLEKKPSLVLIYFLIFFPFILLIFVVVVAKFVSLGQGKSFLVLPQKKEKNNF